MTTEKSAATREANSKLWLDFGPLLVFFGAFHYFKRENPDEAIIWAAGVLAIAATIALAWSWFKHKQTSPILIFSTHWNTQAIRWAIFFFVLAILNEVIWRNFSESFWTGFKVFGFFPLTILFTLSQIPFLHKHATMKQ